MGSSSSFAVGLLNALHVLKGEFISKRELALQAIHLEQDLIQENVGSQDQILTATGGFNRVIFKPTGEHIIEPVIISLERQRELESHLLLFYTGISRFASEIAKTQIDNFKNREKELQAMGQMVAEALTILGSNSVDIKEFGKLLNENWKLKRSLSGSVSSQAIDEMYKTAINHGAIGGKILGAGGGGFLLVFADPKKHAAIIGGLKNLLHVPIKFERSGSRVVLYEPDIMTE
jgi:D-glycero-alpha-D-manno-heptose-7-phosphate kinase